MEKSIILSGINKNNNGVLTVNDEDNTVKLNLNIEQEPYVLVVNVGKMQAFFVEDNNQIFYLKNVDCSIITAVIIKDDSVVLYGSSSNKMQAFSLFSEYKKQKNIGKISIKEGKNSQNNEVFLHKNSKKSVEKTESKIVENLSKKQEKQEEKDRENCKFLQENNDKLCDINDSFTSTKTEDLEDNFINNFVKINKKEDKDLYSDYSYKGDNFYQSIRNQIEEIFVCYPEEKSLYSKIKNSKFSRINYTSDDYYIVGVISLNDNVKYLCYGLPGVKDVLPPSELTPYAKFLQLDNLNNGFWLIFQDGKTGETVQSSKIDLF